MKTALAIGMLVAMGGLLGLPGCSDAPDDFNAEAEHRAKCGEKIGACVNRCNKADLGPDCRGCCREAGVACDEHKSYSFYSCD